MTAQLTVFPLLNGGEEYGWTCEPCRKQKSGMAQRHAQNSLALHNRQVHPEPTLDLAAAARAVLDSGPGYTAALAVWSALTGLAPADAAPFARECAAQPGPLLVHLAPF